MLPPQTIQVKRKRGGDSEDGPVDFLRVEGNKRLRSISGAATWIYQRRQATAPIPKPAAVGPPIIRSTKAGVENTRPVKPLRQQTVKTAAPPAPNTDHAESHPVASGLVRRFHFSIGTSSLSLHAKLSKKRGATAALFVERVAKRQKSQSPERNPAVQNAPCVATPEATGTDAAQPKSQTGKIKRPGQRARTNRSTVPPGQPALPESVLNREDDAKMEELVRDMEDYTLRYIAASLEKMDANTTSRKSRFKPKVPAKRYAERHPEPVIADPSGDTVMTDHSVDSADSDDDYVIETYERVPASHLQDQVVAPHKVGLLVFDTEPEQQEFFFGHEGDSSDEYGEDDEDSNDENHYTADYPEEELDSDDEYDRNPYRYTVNRGFGEQDLYVDDKAYDYDKDDDF